MYLSGRLLITLVHTSFAKTVVAESYAESVPESVVAESVVAEIVVALG